jgi:hypothetical protein
MPAPMPAYPPPYGPAAPYPPAEQAYGYPPLPPAPPRKRRVGLIVSLSIIAILVVAAAGVGAVVAVNRYAPVRAIATPPPSSSAAPSATASPTPVPYTGDLRKLLLPVPAGAKPYTVKILGTDGTITVEQASKDIWGSTDQVDLLKGSGFQRGAWVAWIQDGRSTFDELYQFVLPDLAEKWSDHFLSRDASESYAAGLDVPGMPGAWCQASTKPNPGGDFVVICHGHRGYVNAEVWHFTRGAAEVDATIALLRQQLALLP